jgi:outer membrane immunogenic protein
MIRRSSALWAFTVAAASAAVGAWSAIPAAAADLPVAPGASYYPAQAYAPALYDWSGVYLGANLGIGDLQDSVTTLTTTSYQPAGVVTRLSDLGIVGGPQIGANYEMAPWVIGVEGSWQATNISASSTIGTLYPNDDERSTSDEQWYASATGRIGYAFNTVLVYGKGGAAWTQVRYTQADLNAATGGTVASLQSIDTIRTGFTVGGGVEYGMTEHFSARVEYDFYDFGTKDYNFSSLTAVGNNLAPFPGGFPVSIKSYSHLITTGLYYRFD